jgi:polyisoprenoid-binding protein YceI
MNHFQALLGAAVAVLIASPTPGRAQHVTAIDLARSEIKFVSRQMNVPVEGRFRKFNAKIDFDPAKLASSKAEVEVDLGSIDAGSEEADDEVKGKGWLNIAAYPTARFVSTAVKAAGPGRYEVTGKMTVKGRTIDLKAPFAVKQEGANSVFEGAFTLLRLSWGIGDGAWSDPDTVANEVQVRFRLVALPRKP